MRIWVHIFRAPKRVIVIGKRRQTIKLRRQLIRVKFALAQETVETKEMLDIYRRYTVKQASVEEMKFANQQFLDVLKGLGIGVVAVLPFAPITLPIIIKAGKWVGVDVLPSSFNNSDKKSQ
ncbi:hypothetical protein J7384_15675 [Endozoicomonas sp. G2_1]|uniref:hypothetical protein n=1 Tax=Endozoicomonas sp. G2_1 TaxID=2821091 RepID=UPI001AD97C47|nr:hypothetical protein [Endozoicomonas sp. G2_1]MBO9491799.1 hypothetical protein [Endozoicomonas sp. G2_1]